MKFLNQLPTLLSLAAYLLLIPVQQVSAQTDIHIDGIVRDSITNAVLPGAKVVVIKNSNGERTDSAYTNSYGVYQLDFIWTAIQSDEISGNKIFPSPTTGQSHIQYFAPEAGTYNLQIFNARGKQIVFQKLELHQGYNTITTQGGPNGILLYVLSNETQKAIFKGLRTGENTPITINSIATQNNSQLKSTLDDRLLRIGDDATLEFSKLNYNTSSEQITIVPDMTVNKSLAPTPYTFTTTLKPYLESGEAVTTISPGFNITITYPEPTGTKTYTPNANNEIIINEILYPAYGQLTNITISHDTTNYTIGGVVNGVLAHKIIRYQNQPTNRPNVAQSLGDLMNPEYETTVSIDSLNGKELMYYVLRKNAETQTGIIYRLDGPIPAGLMASSGAIKTSKYIELSQYPHVVLMSTVYDNNTSITASQSNLDRAVNEYNKCANIMNLENGDQVTLPTQFFYTNRNDSIWSACQLRGPPNFDNVELLTFRQGSPGVGRFWTEINTYNGYPRLYYSYAAYSESATNGQIFEENYSATFGITEGSGTLTPFVLNAQTSEPTDLGKAMARWVKLLDLGSN